MSDAISDPSPMQWRALPSRCPDCTTELTAEQVMSFWLSKQGTFQVTCRACGRTIAAETPASPEATT